MFTKALCKAGNSQLTELVLEEAANGDEVSQAIVLQGAQELVELITAVVSRLGWQNMPALIAGIGGLMQPGNLLWDRIQTLLAESCPLSRMILLSCHLTWELFFWEGIIWPKEFRWKISSIILEKLP